MTHKGALMKPHTCLLIVLTLASVLMWWDLGWTQTHREESEQTARYLTMLLNAGRLVVDRNQPLINDPGKGDKGFTPESFEQQVIDEFSHLTSIDLKRSPAHLPALAKELLPTLLESSKQVVADAQFVINQRGIGYKNFIPATFGSQAARKFSNRAQVKMKQTTLNPRNLKNTPDAYEEQVLKRLATQPASNTPVTEWFDGGKTLRVLTPIYYSHDCLDCHGSPQGILDISGYPREGAKEGDLAGAISVQIPLNNP
jgi:general secretion pathway protein A